MACLILALATGGFGSRSLRKENKGLEKERNLINRQKIELQGKIQTQAGVIESFEEIRSVYQDSIKAAKWEYDNLIIRHEENIDNLLSLPTDSLYHWTKDWIRAKSQ